MEYFQYAVLLKKDTSGGYVVTCRDLPQLITQGESIENALFEASDAMDEVFAAYMINNVKLPEPSPKKRGEYMVVPPAETIAKAALHTAMKEARVNKVQMAKRLGVDEKEVRRLLDPHYGSKLPRIAEAISLLGCRLVIGLELA